jgi:glutamate racemase
MGDTIYAMNYEFPSQQPIGIFDSGVGGLSVLRAIRSFLPGENILYVADQEHIPYGTQPKSLIKDFSIGITDFLLSKGAKLIVVACNTASAAALHDLRVNFPDVPFVGMEPALKPAAATTYTGVVGVLATPTTFAGDLYASLVDRFGNGIEIFQSTCPGLVEQIEQGELDTPATQAILQDALFPMLEAGVDTIVLGCTHYPFVIPLIEWITGPEVRTIDPAPAIARQTDRLLAERGHLNTGEEFGEIHFFTSGNRVGFGVMMRRLLGETGRVLSVNWGQDGILRG